MLVNGKRVLRIMREDNLRAAQPRAFVVTTDSDHGLEVFLNLAGRMKLTGINHLWVADITYIRLKAESVCLAGILDGHSRRVVGWALERTLASRLAIAALERAIADRQPPPDLVHHSDRGIQYAGAEHTAILEKHGMIPSMSRPANPYDNASCESFTKTSKRQEIRARPYENLEHLRANIEEFIEEYYNRQRLHSALGYRSPEEFEGQSEFCSVTPDLQSATMQSFENAGNDKRVSELVTGDGDSLAVPFPRPHPLLPDTGNAQRRMPSVPKDSVSLEGYTPRMWERLGNKTCQIPCTTVGFDAG
jgi:putative transposase